MEVAEVISDGVEEQHVLVEKFGLFSENFIEDTEPAVDLPSNLSERSGKEGTRGLDTKRETTSFATTDSVRLHYFFLVSVGFKL